MRAFGIGDRVIVEAGVDEAGRLGTVDAHLPGELQVTLDGDQGHDTFRSAHLRRATADDERHVAEHLERVRNLIAEQAGMPDRSRRVLKVTLTDASVFTGITLAQMSQDGRTITFYRPGTQPSNCTPLNEHGDLVEIVERIAQVEFDTDSEAQLRREADRQLAVDTAKAFKQVEQALNTGSPAGMQAVLDGLAQLHPTLLGKLWNAVAETVEARDGDGRLKHITDTGAHRVRQPLI